MPEGKKGSYGKPGRPSKTRKKAALKKVNKKTAKRK